MKREHLLIIGGTILIARAHRNFGALLELYYEEAHLAVLKKQDDLSRLDGDPRIMTDRERAIAIAPAKIHLVERVLYSYGVGIAMLAIGLDRVK